MMLDLKAYQRRALDSLRAYLIACDETSDPDKSFYACTADMGRGIPYKKQEAIANAPYVCLRIPTGGGKTLLACHCVSVAGLHLLRKDNPVVIWLVPSNAILEQTYNALRDRRHPYRQALDADAGSVEVLSVDEALAVTPGVLQANTTIVLSTIQAFRVEKPGGRRVYNTSGALMQHFTHIATEETENLEKGPGGDPVMSLANVLRIHRPLVIVDEAHNARTGLSFDTIARFNPAGIIEFTATPAIGVHGSNVLHIVSAAELKAEEMIKLPIRLETRTDWKQLLADAVACRAKLEQIARIEQQETGEYIRPILLIQAESHREGQETVSVEVVKQCLLEDLRVRDEYIAVATGTTRELDGVDLFEARSEIRVIITMQALREGWDCSFAYVLCSVSPAHSATAVEQILGRIMRLPKAHRKNRPELNMAYAFAVSGNFADVANSLADALVDNGFDRKEAEDYIAVQHEEQVQLPIGDGLDEKPFFGHVIVAIPEIPATPALSPVLSQKLTVYPTEMKLSFEGVMAPAELDELRQAFKSDDGKAVIERVYRISNGLPLKGADSPAERGIRFSIPVLCVKQGDLFEVFEETLFLDRPWSLRLYDALLDGNEYSPSPTVGQVGMVNVTDEGAITTEHEGVLREEPQAALFGEEVGVTVTALVKWLDERIPHPDISPEDAHIFIRNVIVSLIERRDFTLLKLERDKYRLRNAIATKIDLYRKQARLEAYQTFLDIKSSQPLAVVPEVVFTFDPLQYAPSSQYKGANTFKKHYYPQVGDLGPSGEEFECAQYIDQMPEIEFWVRNIPNRDGFSFWLQTGTDKFYPDFVCKLKDGRILVVESKGKVYWSNDDSKEKRDLGILWAGRSTGKCLFVMPNGPDWEVIRTTVCGRPR